MPWTVHCAISRAQYIPYYDLCNMMVNGTLAIRQIVARVVRRSQRYGKGERTVHVRICICTPLATCLKCIAYGFPFYQMPKFSEIPPAVLQIRIRGADVSTCRGNSLTICVKCKTPSNCTNHLLKTRRVQNNPLKMARFLISYATAKTKH